MPLPACLTCRHWTQLHENQGVCARITFNPPDLDREGGNYAEIDDEDAHALLVTGPAFWCAMHEGQPET